MSSKMTITEALAELKTIGARLEKKRTFVLNNLARQENRVDPHAKEDGGSPGVVERERQAIRSLEERTVRIRASIAQANRDTLVTVGGQTHSIANWLCWRRDVAPNQKQLLDAMAKYLRAVRERALRGGGAVRTNERDAVESKDENVVFNVDELQLAKDIEDIETALGTLDGQLSLKNATVVVEVED